MSETGFFLTGLFIAQLAKEKLSVKNLIITLDLDSHSLNNKPYTLYLHSQFIMVTNIELQGVR